MLSVLRILPFEAEIIALDRHTMWIADDWNLFLVWFVQLQIKLWKYAFEVLYLVFPIQISLGVWLLIEVLELKILDKICWKLCSLVFLLLGDFQNVNLVCCLALWIDIIITENAVVYILNNNIYSSTKFSSINIKSEKC